MLLNKSKIVGLLGYFYVFVFFTVFIYYLFSFVQQEWNDPKEGIPVKVLAICSLLLFALVLLGIIIVAGDSIVNYTIEIEGDLQEIEQRTKSKKDDFLMEDP